LTYITDPVTAEWITSYPPDRDEYYYVDEDALVEMNVTLRSWTAMDINETISKEIPIIYGKNLQVWLGGELYDEEGEVTGKYTLEVEGIGANEELKFFINFTIPTVQSFLRLGRPEPKTGLRVRVYELRSISPYTLTAVRFNPDIPFNLTKKVIERETGAELEFESRDGNVDIDVGAFSVGDIKTIEIHFGEVIEIPDLLEQARYWLFEREFIVPMVSQYLTRSFKGWELIAMGIGGFIFAVVLPYYALKRIGIRIPLKLPRIPLRRHHSSEEG